MDFVRNLQALSETYSPQYISVEEFEAILAASNSMGYGAGGQGYGNGGKGYSNGGQGNGMGGYRNGQNR